MSIGLRASLWQAVEFFRYKPRDDVAGSCGNSNFDVYIDFCMACIVTATVYISHSYE